MMHDSNYYNIISYCKFLRDVSLVKYLPFIHLKCCHKKIYWSHECVLA
jgi:hypothetical protein